MKARQQKKFIGFILLLLVVNLINPFAGRTIPAVVAQSTGDTLPTLTPTPRPSATPTATEAPATPQVWIGRLASNTLGVTLGGGSIFRVSVDGLSGVPIELRSDDELITAESGSKPEYGPYTAEFSPVTEGTWTVSVPSLGASLDVYADNYNLAVIEFVQVPAPEATRLVEPAPTATPLGGQPWEGQVVSETPGSGVKFGRLLVQVAGRDDQPVRLSTPTDVINIANTGQKPRELGPNTVEFTGLTPGKYIIEPLGLNARLEVQIRENVETRVEFRPLPPPPTATGTPLPSATPPPPPPTATPTRTPTPTSTTTPLPTATPLTRWLGAVATRESAAIDDLGVVVVRVTGIEGIPVRLRSATHSTADRRCLTGAPTENRDACSFANLAAGEYLLSPEGLGLSLPVTLGAGEKVLVVFDVEVLPSGVVGWQAHILENTNSAEPTTGIDGLIRVRVEGRAGQLVALRSVRGTERVCEVTPNPVAGGLVCEFDGLRPGVYSVEALNTGASQRIFMDGSGRADILFAPNATAAAQAAQSPPVVGQGAAPHRLTPTDVPADEFSTVEEPTPPPTAVIEIIPTATPLPAPTATPTTAFAWQGYVIETVDRVIGTIGVRVVGLKDHPVILRSGDWQSQPQLTGSKPELGDYAVEFGGLAPGEYTIELAGLAEYTVTLGPNQFMLVEFRYDFVK